MLQVLTTSSLDHRTTLSSNPSPSIHHSSRWAKMTWWEVGSYLLASIAIVDQKAWKISNKSCWAIKTRICKFSIIKEKSIKVIIIDSKLILIAYCMERILAQRSWLDTSPTSTPRRCSLRRLINSMPAAMISFTSQLTWRTTVMSDMPLSTLLTLYSLFLFMRTLMESHGRDSTQRKSAKSLMAESRANKTSMKTSLAKQRIEEWSPWLLRLEISIPSQLRNSEMTSW